MAFDWYDFLTLARSLHQQVDSLGSEAARRTLVNRAYYGAFCFVRDYARDHLGFQPKDEAADHAALRARLRRGKTQILSERLEDLRQWRNACDYVTDLPFDLANIAESALDQAGRVFKALGHPSTKTPSPGNTPGKQP